MDYRTFKERRNEALTKRLVAKIGNNWREFKGEKREENTMNTVGPAAFLVLMPRRALYASQLVTYKSEGYKNHEIS